MKKILAIALLLVAGRVCAAVDATKVNPDSADKMGPIEIAHEVASVVHDGADTAQEVVGEVHGLAEFAEEVTDPSGDQQPTMPELGILQQLVVEIKSKLAVQGLSDEQIYDFFTKINGLQLTPAQVISFLKDFSEATSQNIDTSSTSTFGKISSKFSSPKYAAAVSGVTCLIVGILIGRYLLSK